MATLVMTFDSSTGKIFAQKVGSDQIGNQAIASAHIGAGIIGTPHLADNAVTSGKVGSGAMTPDMVGAIAESILTSAGALITAIVPGVPCILEKGSSYDVLTVNPLTVPNLNWSPILSAHIFENQIATPHIADQGILSASIAAQIGAAHFFTPPFTSGYVIIGQGSGVTPVYGGVPAGTPGDNTITSSKIASGQVGDGHIYPASIVSGKIGANIIATPHILNQGILSASFGAAVLAGVHIYSGSIADTNLVNALITSSKIASGIVGIPHFQPWVSGKVIVGQGTTTTPITKDQMAAIAFVIDGGGSVITSGGKGHIEVPFPCTLNSVRLLGDQSGQIDVHIWKDTFALFPPTSGDTICSSFLPRISGSFKYEETSLSGWARGILSGDILAFTVTPVASSIQRCTVSLGVYK